MTAPLLRRRPSAIPVAMALVIVLASCTRTTVEQAEPSGTTDSGDRRAATTTAPDSTHDSSIEWRSCRDQFQCATIEVPLDHDDPTGSTIELALIKRPASNGQAPIGALVMNPGGPGGSGYDFLTGSSFPEDLEQTFDLVSWDTRGTGHSDELRCTTTVDSEAFRSLDSDPDTPDEQSALEAESRSVADECGSNDLPLLENSTTTATAHDLEAIREALGEASLTYMGFSYGTQIGQEYARLYPDRVRAMVLDGVVDPSQALQDLLRDQAAMIESIYSPATLAAYDELLAQAEEEPLDGWSDASITPGVVALAAIASAFFPNGDTTLHTAARRALAGDTELIESLALAYDGAGSFVGYLAVSCTDTPFAPGIEAWNQFARDMKSEYPRFGAPIANELLPCAYWAVPPTRTTQEVGTDGLPPLLVIGTTGDPATPYASAQRVAAAIPNATLLTLDGAGHVAFGKSGCIDEAITTYLIELTPPPANTVCQPS